MGAGNVRPVLTRRKAPNSRISTASSQRRAHVLFHSTAVSHTLNRRPPAHDVAVVLAKGARRWQAGHPWIYRSDVATRPSAGAGAVVVHDQRGKPIGTALWSPASEISLRMVDRDPHGRLDADWWRKRIGRAIERRDSLRGVATAY